MSQPSVFRLCAVGLALLVAGCSSTPALSASDRAQIEASSDAWRSAMNARDLSAVASLYTRDAVLLPQNAPTVRGRAAIEDFLNAFPPIKDMQTVRLEVEGAGELAYVWGSYSMQLELPGSSTPVEDRGKFLEIWRKQEDGTWRIDRDIYNSDLPAAPAH